MLRTKIYQMFSHSKICIIGGGTGGLNLSAHLLRAKINPKDIRIFDASQKHYYQPGWTMVGANIAGSETTQRPMSEILPSDIPLTKQNVSRVDPEKNQITTQNGQTFTYDHVIFASGFKLNYEKIKGAREALDNPSSPVGSIYSINYAEKTAKISKQFKGGQAIFTESPAPIKCAGAPQKILYLLTDQWQKAGLSAKVSFIKPAPVLFGVPKYSAALTKVAASYGIETVFKHNLVEVKDNLAIFENVETKELVQRHFDFLHIVPPMSAHSYIADSGLADAAGFLDIDKGTLRHTKYNNVWGIGDCTSTPNSKTAAAVFSQTPILVKNLTDALRNINETSTANYEGYSSCPLFVGQDKLILAEFKYGGVVDETFFNDQQKPRLLFYYLKTYAFPNVYWHLVPRGLWAGRCGIKIV